MRSHKLVASLFLCITPRCLCYSGILARLNLSYSVFWGFLSLLVANASNCCITKTNSD